MAADDTSVTAVANARRGYLEPTRLLVFTGTGDTRQAPHQMDSPGLSCR